MATGPAKGQRVFIPQVSITPSDTERMPFTLRRRQFPVRPAFAMTINKAQRQTLKIGRHFSAQACIYTWPVVCGHVTHWVPEGVKLLVIDGWEDAHEDAHASVYTRNVVYTEVL